MSPRVMPEPDRRELAERAREIGATLNGRPAIVAGVRNTFATVADRETGLEAEWSWFAVAHVLNESGGRFRA